MEVCFETFKTLFNRDKGLFWVVRDSFFDVLQCLNIQTYTDSGPEMKKNEEKS